MYESFTIGKSLNSPPLSPKSKMQRISDFETKISSDFDMNNSQEKDPQGCDSPLSSLQLSKSSIAQSHDPSQFKSKSNHLKIAETPYSMKTLSDMSFNNSPEKDQIPSEAWRMSEAITSAKNSFYEENKDPDERFSIHYTSFALPSRMFCNTCDKEVFTTVAFQLVDPGFWQSFENLLHSFKCCEDNLPGKERQLVHNCSKCHKVLARISAGI